VALNVQIRQVTHDDFVGVAHIAPFLDLTVEQWDATMDVNVRALFLVTQLVARDWVARAHRGVIVNVSSQASMVRCAVIVE
jgi:NAD(P)-dependent dehydrogenase (short-subunit alcohol dehydrogenase family)